MLLTILLPTLTIPCTINYAINYTNTFLVILFMLLPTLTILCTINYANTYTSNNALNFIHNYDVNYTVNCTSYSLVVWLLAMLLISLLTVQKKLFSSLISLSTESNNSNTLTFQHFNLNIT